MKNITTHYTNLTAFPLNNPFDRISPERYSDLPWHLRDLTTELLHYEPSIKTTLHVTISNGKTHVSVTME